MLTFSDQFMYNLDACNSLKTKKNIFWSGFEWLPDEEGIKTFQQSLAEKRKRFEWLPDEEGIKTLLNIHWMN